MELFWIILFSFVTTLFIGYTLVLRTRTRQFKSLNHHLRTLVDEFEKLSYRGYTNIWWYKVLTRLTQKNPNYELENYEFNNFLNEQRAVYTLVDFVKQVKYKWIVISVDGKVSFYYETESGYIQDGLSFNVDDISGICEFIEDNLQKYVWLTA